jgi:FemAB-related protein (PEP-CTERM system-associated)
MNIIIEELNSINLSADLKNQAFLYHTNLWQQFISKSFSFNQKQQCFIIAKDQETNEIKTILPITKIKSKIFGNRILSTGFQEYGGVIGDQSYFPKMLKFLKNKYQKNFQFLEIKGSINQNNTPSEKILIKKVNYQRFILQLKDEKTVWDNIQKSKRKAIKKSKKECTCRELTINDLNQFYNLYLQNMRSFGTPPYNKQYFYNFFKMIQSQGHGKIYGSFKDNKLISALLGFNYNNTVHITTAISNPKYKAFRPSDLMHWYFINWSIKNNYTSFDFGRVRTDSGQFEYKRKWGAQLSELPSFYFLLKDEQIPKLLDPSNKKYQLIIKIWQHLPLNVTKLVGMRLRKELGI